MALSAFILSGLAPLVRVHLNAGTGDQLECGDQEYNSHGQSIRIQMYAAWRFQRAAEAANLPCSRIGEFKCLKSPSALLLDALNSLSYFAKLEKASLALFGIHLLHIGNQVFI